MEFRVHHILCTQLYRGMGYDGAFCSNMTAIVSALRQDPDTRLRLVCHADAICRNCPNRNAADLCTNGDNHVAIKDRELLEPLRLEEGARYSYGQLLEHSAKYLTWADFEASCRSCEWFSLCRELAAEAGLWKRETPGEKLADGNPIDEKGRIC